MSGNRRPPQPYVPAVVGDTRAQLAALADAISRKADITSEPVYNAVLLMAPGGATWRVTVDDAGALHTAVVPR
jgi:hypothetical protein